MRKLLLLSFFFLKKETIREYYTGIRMCNVKIFDKVEDQGESRSDKFVSD